MKISPGKLLLGEFFSFMVKPNSSIFTHPLKKCEQNKILIISKLQSLPKTIRVIAGDCGLHPTTCTRLLHELVAEGRIPPGIKLNKARAYFKNQ